MQRPLHEQLEQDGLRFANSAACALSINYLSPVARSAQRQAPLQPSRNQGRYRTAGRILQVRADRRVLLYATGGSNAARHAPVINRRQAEQTLPHACCAFSATTGATPAMPESGAISHSRAGFASESRQARTLVRNWRIERSKARSGKARSLRVQKKFRCRATRFCTVMCGDFEFCKERYEGVYQRYSTE